MHQSKLFDIAKAYSYLITPVILVYSLYIMLDQNNIVFGICGALIFILQFSIFLLMANFKDIYAKLYKIFYISYSIIASIIIIFVFIWQIGFHYGFEAFILGGDKFELTNEMTMNVFFSIIIILGIGGILLRLIKYCTSNNENQGENL
ncbi:MAG: hypothetical protein FWC47_12705 [Oscillospiraceae bacterium]|nr:hypothetical protein [Oscillospiraceae bacterium]